MASLALTPRGHLLFTATDGTFQPPDGLAQYFRMRSAIEHRSTPSATAWVG
jgi:hypothetical protein